MSVCNILRLCCINLHHSWTWTWILIYLTYDNSYLCHVCIIFSCHIVFNVLYRFWYVFSFIYTILIYSYICVVSNIVRSNLICQQLKLLLRCNIYHVFIYFLYISYHWSFFTNYLKHFSYLLFVRYGHLIALGHWVNESLHSRYIVCCPSLFRYRLVQMFWLTNAWRKNFNSNLLRRIVFSGATLNWCCWLLLWWWSIVFDSFWDHALWLWSFLFLPIIWLRLHHVLGFDW